MLGLVLSDNLIMLLIFWEIMGLCSYLLIGFWFARKYDDPKQITPKEAGLKAFLTTRIGDTIMLAGILLLYIQTGSLSFAEIFKPETLEQLATTTVNLPLIGADAVGHGDRHPDLLRRHRQERAVPAARLAARRDGRPDPGLGADPRGDHGVGGRLPDHPHLPADGRRSSTAPALQFIAFIGAFTALFAATIAVAQNDIKKVLAYSTISQLGYMFAALGIGAYVAATFHLLTHAFFKALLFLGSGSVIHGMEHGHHEAAHGTWRARRSGGARSTATQSTDHRSADHTSSTRRTCATWAGCSARCRARPGPSSSAAWR